jgi:signal transduction histidine kinase
MKPSRAHRWTQATLNAVATPVLIVAVADRIVRFVNRAATELVGSRAVGRTVIQAFGLDAGRKRVTDGDGHTLADDEGPVARASRGEDVGPLELFCHDGDSTTALVCYAEKVPGDGQEPEVVVLSIFDVTELKKVQSELARVESRRDEFVALAAHELRTPLTCLRLQIDAAGRKHPELAFVVALRRAVDRMSKRVEQLVDVVEMREHLVVLHPEPADLREIAEDGFRLLEAQAMWARCPVTLPSGPPVLGRWDKRRLTQVVASLLSNAVKFGAGKPIEVVTCDEDVAASISVVDHGIGIGPEDRAAIFERYQRRASAAHFAGLGLDLWITLELLRQMGGTIDVGNTAGGGATFTFRVPKLYVSGAAIEPTELRVKQARDARGPRSA